MKGGGLTSMIEDCVLEITLVLKAARNVVGGAQSWLKRSADTTMCMYIAFMYVL